MRYEEIKNYFEKGQEGLIDLLKNTVDVRDSIEDYTQQLMNNIINTADEYKIALNKLDGYYAFVTLIAGIAKVAADTEEANAAINAKSTPVDDGTGKVKAPTDEIVKAKAKIAAAEYMRIYEIFERYARICEKRMMTIQSQLNHIEFDIEHTKK